MGWNQSEDSVVSIKVLNFRHRKPYLPLLSSVQGSSYNLEAPLLGIHMDGRNEVSLQPCSTTADSLDANSAAVPTRLTPRATPSSPPPKPAREQEYPRLSPPLPWSPQYLKSYQCGVNLWAPGSRLWSCLPLTPSKFIDPKVPRPLPPWNT